MDCGGWVDSGRLFEAHAQFGTLTRDVVRWTHATHESFRDTFGSPGAVFLVTLARLDHEGALEL
eukprot:3756442-Alexandrium_andersonii.AAC.1